MERYFAGIARERKTMSSNSEAPASVSSVVYYRGVAMTITKRDPEVSIKPLVEKQMEMIDWTLDEINCKPSWNEETNKAHLNGKANTQGATNGNGLSCPKCGSPLVPMTTKTGKQAMKCSTNKWNPTTKQADGCDYIKWAQMTNADL